ncbi:hypothetical protein PUATCC27989T_05188 [Phytobacter ursingii]|nr:hypothetical protein PUATCC27989T_05188 [Phytobacter ursingii]
MSNNIKYPNICYFCGQGVVSGEHIPPKNLFPETPQYRYELIKLPSCDKHNKEKSTLDERMLVFLMGVNKTVCTERDFNKIKLKTIRAIMRNKHLFNNLTDNARIIKNKNNKNTLFLPNINDVQVKINYNDHRFYQECILRGLYFHTYKKTWPGEIFILPRSLVILEGDSKSNVNDFEIALGIEDFENHVIYEQSLVSKNKVFQYKELSIDDIKIFGACIYMEYFFYGVFCEDNEKLKRLKGIFSDTDIVSQFNNPPCI